MLLLPGPEAAALDRPTYLGPRPPAQVRRVVTIAPSLTETVLALGAGERLVGVSRFDELAEVKELPRVGGFVDPSVEAVLALRPDLLLVQPAPGNQAAVEKLAQLGVPVLVLPMDSIRSTEEAIGEVGRALGLSQRARVLVQSLRATREEVRRRAREKPPLKVLFVYGFEPLVVAGRGSFAHELLSDAGGVNAAQDASSAYTVYSAESAVRSRPQVVVDAAMVPQGRETLQALPGLREARWVKLSNQDLLHPGPHLGRGLEELFRLLHPAP